jgi:hypothetical protein
MKTAIPVPTPPEFLRGMSRLIRKCPSCGGHGCEPAIPMMDYEGTRDRCLTCGPVREWLQEYVGLEFECLT